jgi:membrane associated rhomboid family serine protease
VKLGSPEARNTDAERADQRVKLAFRFGPVYGAFALLARYVPWVFSYVLGPAILVASGWFFLKFRPLFFFFKSEGSPAGMLVPLLLWPLLVLAVWVGWWMIKLGRHLQQEQR